jgi:hypothetical protein
VLDEPTVFSLDDDYDIGACTGSRHGGTTGPGDPEEACWAAMCRTVGLPIDDLPWVTGALDQVRTRFYLNSGVFAYRTTTGFGDLFFDYTDRVLEQRIASDKTGIALVEQSVFGLAILRGGLRFRLWSDLYNYSVVPTLRQFVVPERLRAAKLLHYHRSMDRQHWDAFVDLIRRELPALAPWLNECGPIAYRYDGPLMRRLLRRPLQLTRNLRRRWYERTAQRRWNGA